MPLRAFTPRQRLLVIAGAALLLPALVALALQVAVAGRERRDSVKRMAATAARQIVLVADARAEADLASLRLVAGAAPMRGPPREARAFAEAAVATYAGWRSLTLTDAGGRRIMSTTGAPTPRPPAAIFEQGLVDGVSRHEDGAASLWLFAPAGAGRVLTLGVAPEVVQAATMELIPAGAVAAIVDRDGDFIARSIAFEERVGTPGSSYLRGAVKRGGAGLYRGRTLEGFENYTAYATSAKTGWSGHVAVDAALLDGPRARFGAGALLATTIALALAGAIIGYVLLDLAQRRREEEGLLALQKSDALARFTAGVVHDLRNVLSVMQGALHLIVRNTKEPETLAHAQEGERALQRGLKVSNQLLSFARDGTPELNSLDLAALLGAIDDLLRRALGEGVTLSVSIAEDARWVLANADQLELAFFNLALNARDAMDGAGRVSIAAERDGAWVCVRVADSGPGVPRHLRGRLFDPFFTTKESGKGTGLGLAQVAGAVRQAGGDVTIEDAPGGGALFVLRLQKEKGQ